MKKTKVITIQCPNCKDIVYSRSRHDCRGCFCGQVAIDGGFDYNRILFKKIRPKLKSKYVIATKEDLYNDWNDAIDKFGLIKSLTHKKKQNIVSQ